MNIRTTGFASQHQIRKLCCILINAIPRTLTVEQADALLERRLDLEKEIEKMLTASSPPPSSSPTETPDAKVNYWKTLIVEELDKLETAFPLALQLVNSRQSGRVSQEDLAKVLNCSHPTIGKVFRCKDTWKGIAGLDRLPLIEELSREFPQRWINLRSEKSSFIKHFRR